VPEELEDETIPPLVLSALVREVLQSARGSGAITVQLSADATDLQLRIAVACEQAEGVRLTLDVPLANATEPLRSPEAVPAPKARALPAGLSLFFIALAALNINTTVTSVRANGLVIPRNLAIVEALLATSCITLALYVAIRLARQGFGARMVTRHLVAGVALGSLNAIARMLFVLSVGHPYTSPTLGGVLGRAVSGMMIYFVFAGIVGAFEYARRHRGAETQGLRLAAELAEAERRRMEAELRALKAELNPHFLGNALAGAAALVRSDPARARAMLEQLADVVDTVVSRVGTQEVTLQEELDGLAPFIALEQSRLGERLAVQWDVEEQAREARVPHLILQPLVENAVKHGLSQRGGRIVVGGRRTGDRLQLSVRDDGVGLEKAREATQVRRGGIGLANSRARLEQLYGPAATLELAPAPGAGTIVTVTLPWR
jgi:signal transduction histidine kinase